MPVVPRATYRIQFHAGFPFEAAGDIADYLAGLGVSHLYASPYLQAAPGSTHGYDVVDPGRVNEELGGEEGHARLQWILGERNLGQVLDVVPNHMAISGPENTWWWDVLENGPSSRYAAYFDVEWESPEGRHGNRILLPVLGDHYGRVVEAREIVLERREGSFLVRYYDHVFPVAPRSLAGLIARAAARSGSDDLAFIADSLEVLPLPTATDRSSIHRRHRGKEVIRRQLGRLLQEEEGPRAAVDALVAEVNGYPDLMDDLLQHQNYRLAFWRAAGSDLGYRRFFDVNSLAALRVEDETVFADTHRRVLDWLRNGVLDGVRIDHPDGLRDPQEYLRRLREAAPGAWIVVEKILHRGERLPDRWPVEGTTGYEYLNLAGGLAVDPAGERPLTRLYREFTGEPSDYRQLVLDKKHEVLRDVLGSDVNRLTDLAQRVCEQHRRYRDYSRQEIREALEEAAACFPVYRTYVRAEAGRVSREDRRTINRAFKLAKSRRGDLDPELFDFLRDLLLLRHRGELEAELVMRFQQLTGPATAKGVEDTAFYCFHRLVCLNEVGGDPGRFGTDPATFHRAMIEASERRPHAMLTTSTHDTKRSEDVRARIALLSEIPERWGRAVRGWAAHNERHRTGGSPDRNLEYLYYQTLVGAWPLGADRAEAYMQKAAREAKQHTSWTRPDPAYEEGVQRFVNGTLDDGDFVADLEAFVAPLVEPGRVNALAQTLLKLTCPGVPDIYQGTELWNLSLVDPDNRRPVDFELRRRLLEEEPDLTAEETLARMDEGLPKLRVTRRTLALRTERPGVFGAGSGYRPLETGGSAARHLVAFLRGDSVAVAVPRLGLGLREGWGDATVELPEGRWENVFTGEETDGGRREVAGLLARFPVLLLAAR